MRKLILSAVAAISISGCSTTGGLDGIPSAATVLAQVQQYTQQACGFLPLVSTDLVASMLAAYFPQGASLQLAVATIGAAICAGTTPKSLGRSAAIGTTVYKTVSTPKGSVRVLGRFVR